MVKLIYIILLFIIGVVIWRTIRSIRLLSNLPKNLRLLNKLSNSLKDNEYRKISKYK